MFPIKGTMQLLATETGNRVERTKEQLLDEWAKPPMEKQ
jgi:hypothetical protein